MFRMNYDLMKNTSLSWKTEKKNPKTKTPCPLISITHAKIFMENKSQLMAIQNACYWSVFNLLAIASSR